MKKIIFLSGLPASGKSSYAKQQSGSYKRVNKDDLRKMIDNSVFSFENEKIIKKIQKNIIKTFLELGHNVIVDDTNLKETDYIRICDIANEVGDVRVTHTHMDVDVEECIERDFSRTGNEHVGPERIREIAKALDTFKIHEPIYFGKKNP